MNQNADEKQWEAPKNIAEERRVNENDGGECEDVESELSEEDLLTDYQYQNRMSGSGSDYEENNCFDFVDRNDIFATTSEEEGDFDYSSSFGSSISSSHENMRLPNSGESVVMVGDEMIEIAGDLVCRTDIYNMTRVCLPGAKIADVLELIPNIVRGEDIVLLHIGTNDIPMKMMTRDLARYRMLLNVCKQNCYVVVIGLIPRWDFLGRWLNRSRFINKKLKELCAEAGVEFVDVWSKFETRFDYFDQDGIYLNRVGIRLLADIMIMSINKAKMTLQTIQQ